MLWCLFFFAVFLCFLHLLLNYNAKARSIRRIPGPGETFIFGDTLQMMRSSVDLMKKARELAATHPGIYRLWTFPFGAVNIYNAQDVEVIMSSMKYHEKSDIYKILKPWLGGGLLLSNGSKWQERRKILTPAFHFNILCQFCQVIEENAQELVEILEQCTGRIIDLTPVLSEFTLKSICETAMGTQLNEGASSKSYRDAIHDIGDICRQRFCNAPYLIDFIFNWSPLRKKQTKHLKVVHGFTKKVIKERKQLKDIYGTVNDDVDMNEESNIYKKKKKTAMLDLLISAEREGKIDGEGIQEEVDTFMFEGHDTTASGLTFCFMLLANNKDVQYGYRKPMCVQYWQQWYFTIDICRKGALYFIWDKIVEELVEIFGDSKRPITLEDLPKMKYLERCIKESLRLYPPVHFVSRNLNEKVILSNYEVPAGTFCHVNIYDLHRRPELFPNPDKFDPDRFLPENSVGRHPYAYIPFSAGPRNCIGQKFAMMEMKVAVAKVLREFELNPITTPADIELITDIVLRNNGPVEVVFRKRI